MTSCRSSNLFETFSFTGKIPSEKREDDEPQEKARGELSMYSSGLLDITDRLMIRI